MIYLSIECTVSLSIREHGHPCLNRAPSATSARGGSGQKDKIVDVRLARAVELVRSLPYDDLPGNLDQRAHLNRYAPAGPILLLRSYKAGRWNQLKRMATSHLALLEA
jgi:hypothetical protein